MSHAAEIHHANDMAAMLACQRAAFLRDGPPGLAQRRASLARLREAVLAHRHDLEEAVNADFGHRSRHETGLMELAAVVQAIDYLTRHLRRFMKPQRRHVDLYYRAGRAYVAYQPLGVVGVMSPWNYPVSLTLVPLATALAAGNRAMLKPSELTPRTSETMRQLLAGVFPGEEVAVVLGGPDVGAAFSALPFDHLLFTGSTPVGRKVMQAASDHLVPVTLELGGKSPAIVARGHVNDRTMSSLVFGKLANAGQTCVAPDYALVHEDDLEAFVARYDATVARFYPGGPASADYTSIVSERHHARLKDLIDDARRTGARVIEVGACPKDAAMRPRTLAPMLILGAGDDAAVLQEEIFGPILPVLTYRAMDEVVDHVNARPRPLALYYFGEEDDDCKTLLSRTTSGNVGINNTLMHVAQDDLPFGGVGASGMGAYHGVEGFRAMSHAKGVFVQGRWHLSGLLHAPFGKFAEWTLAMMLGKRRGPSRMIPPSPGCARLEGRAGSPLAGQRVLVVVTNHADYPDRKDKTGLWLTELTHFWDVFEAAGVVMDIASPNGGNTPLDVRSMGRFHLDDAARAHLREPAFMERLAHTRRAADLDPADYAAIYFTGGHGTLWDFRQAPDLKRLAEAIYRQGGIVSAVCHGNAALIQLQGADGRPLIEGRRVTGFSNVEERLAGIRDQVPFLLQDDMAGVGAKYEKALLPFVSHLVTDGRLVTGQNPRSSRAVARQVLALLSRTASTEAQLPTST